MNKLEKQPRTELPRPPETIPGVEVWSERLTERFDRRTRLARMRAVARFEELMREADGAKRVLAGTTRTDERMRQIDGIATAAHAAFTSFSTVLEQSREAREEAGEKMRQQIVALEQEIGVVQKSAGTKEEKQARVREIVEELQGLAQELPLSLRQKDAIREASDEARAAVELEAVEEPQVKGVQTILKYLESENLLDEREPDLEMWKSRNLEHVEKLKLLYGGRFPDEVPGHIGFLLMNMDTRLDHARSMVGRPQEFQFALKRYSTLVNHFGELVDEVAARVELQEPGLVDKVTGLLQEKQRIQGSLVSSTPEQRQVAQIRIDQIIIEVAELQGRIRAAVSDHMRQLPPPEAELIPHKGVQWGPYGSEEDARTGIQALLSAQLPDTIWLEELSQVKDLVEFYEGRIEGLPTDLQQKIENKIRYFRLKFSMLRDKLVAEGVLSKEMASLHIPSPLEKEEQWEREKGVQKALQPSETPLDPQGPSPQEPQPQASTVSMQEQPTQPTESTLHSEEIALDEAATHEPGEVVYVHRPTGERFVIDTTYHQVVLPSSPQMLVTRNRLATPLPAQELQDAERVEKVVELLLKRRDEEIRFMKELTAAGPFEVIQEVLNMPYVDFEAKDQFTTDLKAYMKQEGIKTGAKTLRKIHNTITNYLVDLRDQAAADGRSVGEVISDGIKFRLAS